MSRSLFARPNLKLFLLGAILVLVVNDLMVGPGTHASARTVPSVGKRGQISERDLVCLRQHLAANPSSEGFARLSYCYQQRGEYRKALDCLSHADRLAEQEN